jgi:hypothetical protein
MDCPELNDVVSRLTFLWVLVVGMSVCLTAQVSFHLPPCQGFRYVITKSTSVQAVTQTSLKYIAQLRIHYGTPGPRGMSITFFRIYRRPE